MNSPSGKKGGSPRSGGKDQRSDRKSRSGMIGSPKKDGRGGKFTWSGHAYSEAELGDALRSKGPNFQNNGE